MIAAALLAGCGGSGGGAVPDHGEKQRVHRDPAAAVARHLRHPIMTVAHPSRL
jgi:hypothetical protein